MSKLERCNLADAELDEKCSKAKRKDAAMVMLRDESYAVMAHYGLGEVRTIHWMDTGFYPDNRSKTGIVPSKVTEKVDDYFTAGISRIELAKACVLGRDSGPKGDHNEQRNIEVSKASSEQIAPVAPKSLKQFTVTNNHTVQVGRAVICEIPHPNKDLAPQGNIQRSIFEGRQPDFQAMARDGFLAFVIDPIIEEKKPAVLKLIIDADNIPNSSAAQDTTAALLWKCHMEVVAVDEDPDMQGSDEKARDAYALARISFQPRTKRMRWLA